MAPDIGCEGSSSRNLLLAAPKIDKAAWRVGSIREGIQRIGQVIGAIGLEHHTPPAAHAAGIDPGFQGHARTPDQGSGLRNTLQSVDYMAP